MANYEARPVNELRDEMLGRAADAALAVTSDPRCSYRFRLAKAIIGEAGALTERQVYTAWRDVPELSRIVRVFHNLIVDVCLEGLADAIDQCAQSEAQSFLDHH